MTSPLKFGAIPACLFLALSACDEGNLLARGDAVSGEAQAGVQTSSVTQDVEMPEIFSTQELALWDGRPSLGGVWVAHPDVTDPERVRINNTSTGQSTEGALFRRERDAPGPRLQVSSEAARVLDILAGQPTELAVVVIREETIEIEVPAPDALELPAGEDAPVTDIAVVAVGADDLTANAAVETLGDAEVVAAQPQPQARRGFWGRFRDSLRGTSAPQTSAGAIATGADTAFDVAVSPAPEVETAPLDPVASVAAAAIDAAEDQAAAQPGNAYIQVGLFGREENANGAAATLRENGILPAVVPTEVGGKNYWRVLVGPLATASDRADVIDTIRGLGFPDAYFTAS